MTKSEKAKQLRMDRLSKGLCVMCGKTEHLPDIQKCNTCNEQMKAYPVRRSEQSLEQRRAYNRKRTKALYDKRRKDSLCTYCGKVPSTKKDYCDFCYTAIQEANKKSRSQLKELAFSTYGGYKCACCGLTKAACFMQLDHIDGKGHSHLQASGKRYKGATLYRWLKKHNYPCGFQVLCADCNFAKGSGEKCPHQAPEWWSPERLNNAAGLLSYF